MVNPDPLVEQSLSFPSLQSFLQCFLQFRRQLIVFEIEVTRRLLDPRATACSTGITLSEGKRKPRVLEKGKKQQQFQKLNTQNKSIPLPRNPRTQAASERRVSQHLERKKENNGQT